MIDGAEMNAKARISFPNFQFFFLEFKWIFKATIHTQIRNAIDVVES